MGGWFECRERVENYLPQDSRWVDGDEGVGEERVDVEVGGAGVFGKRDDVKTELYGVGGWVGG